MREVAFIEQNKEKWLNFEHSFFGVNNKTPDELANLYIEIVNDLAYAQTFYPKSKTIEYLNELAAKAYLALYKTKRTEKNKLFSFFKTELPLIAYQYRKCIYISFLIFGLFVLIGISSTLTDQAFVRMILGDGYVNMTIENIESGDPVAVYKSGSDWGGFLGITINNIRVSTMAFVYGIFGGVGTIYVLMQNGIMLGAFQTMFYNEGVLWESMRGIWIHGAIEIFSIIISGAAGLILAKGILFPKSYSRFQSFKIHFSDGFKLLLSTTPFFIIAGFLEGFVTRYSNVMPLWLASFIILGSLALITYYYILYPILFNKQIQKHGIISK